MPNLPVPRAADVVKAAVKQFHKERLALRQGVLIKKLWEIQIARDLLAQREMEYDLLINGMIE